MVEGRTLALGVIGSGFAGATVIAAAAGLPDARVIGVYGGGRVSELAAQHGVRLFSDVEEMLTAVDAIVVATPHASHAEYCRMALEADLHVFCEKPFVTDSTDGAVLVELARARGLTLSVNHFQRYRTPNAAAFEALRENRIGPLVGGHCRLVETPMAKPWQMDAANVGFLLGYGVHAIDLLCWWLDQPVRSVAARSCLDDLGVEHSTVATLRFDDAEVQLVTTDRMVTDVGGQVGRASFASLLIGRDGMLDVDSYGTAYLYDPRRTVLGTLPSWQSFHAPERLAAYRAAVAQFVQACLTGAAPQITAEQALHAVAVCEAAAISTLNGGASTCV
jgi:predicted dehydrogenase